MAEISRHPPAESASNYRAEIDGLRAVAVIAVIINHFDHAILPGGFLGVDIFFVISGYVITASLWRNRSINFKSFLSGFYQRRLKRLLPALLLVIVVSSLLIRLLSPDPGVYLGVGWRAIFGISNIQLYKMSSDYFGQDISLNPFTHTWSLGVEEQFYLIFPWLVWISGFGRRPAGSKSLLAILMLIAIPSLGIFLWLYPHQHAAAYFLMPPRFWELAAGSLLFAWQVDRHAVAQPQPLGLAAAAMRPARLHRGLPLAVLLLMLATMLVPHQQGSWTIPATVLLTVLLIAWLRPGDWGHRLLSQKPMVKLGLMSYSLYLWHWPVLCFSRWTIGIQPWSVPFQLGLILVLAKLCYQYVESPLRRANWGQQNRRIFQLSLLMTAATATVLAGLARLPRGSLYLGDLQREDRENTFMRVQGTAISDKTCNWFRGEGPDPRQAKIDCTLIGQRWRGGPRVFVRGDSHTGHLVAWLADRQRRDHHWLQLLYVSSIPAPLIPIQWPADEAAWRHQDERVQTTLIEESLNQLRPGDVLILANHLQLRLGRTLSREQGVGRVELERRWQVWLRELEVLLDRAQARGAHVVLMLPTPEFPTPAGETANQLAVLCSRQWFRPITPSSCQQQLPRHEVAVELNEIKARLEPIASKFNNLLLFDPFPLICKPDQRDCSNYSGNVRMYYDRDHLSFAGSQLLVEPLNRLLSRAGLLP